MDIKKLYAAKTKLKEKIDSIDAMIMCRWEQLIRTPYSRWMRGWSVGDEVICIRWGARNDEADEEDQIPIKFFEIEDTNEAIKQYRQYKQEEQKKHNEKTQATMLKRERSEYERLKAKFEK